MLSLVEIVCFMKAWYFPKPGSIRTLMDCPAIYGWCWPDCVQQLFAAKHIGVYWNISWGVISNTSCECLQLREIQFWRPNFEVFYRLTLRLYNWNPFSAWAEMQLSLLTFPCNSRHSMRANPGLQLVQSSSLKFTLRYEQHVGSNHTCFPLLRKCFNLLQLVCPILC